LEVVFQNSAPNNKTGLSGTLQELSKPTAYKPFILLLAIFLLQQSTGTFAVIFYAVNVFQVAHFVLNLS